MPSLPEAFWSIFHDVAERARALLLGRLYANKPLDFVLGLISDVRAGGLSSSLRNWGWVNSLSAYEYGSFQGTTVVSIDVDLTLLGFLHVDDVATTIFAFLHKIIAELDGNAIDTTSYDEQRKMGDIDFNFLDKSGASSTVQARRSDRRTLPPYCHHMRAHFSYFAGRCIRSSTLPSEGCASVCRLCVVLIPRPKNPGSCQLSKAPFYFQSYAILTGSGMHTSTKNLSPLSSATC